MGLDRRLTERQRDPIALGEALKAFFKESGLARQVRDHDIHEAWTTSLGPRMAQRARSVLYRNGELVVEVQSAAHKHELEAFTAEQYRRKANQQLGSERIQRVTIKLKK